jgi:stearoyl-CoA desaturase (delta-9 desaturase)
LKMSTKTEKMQLEPGVVDFLTEQPKDSAFISTEDSTKFAINWPHTILLTVTPILAFIGFFTTVPKLPTVILGLFFYYWSGFGITAGYHRLFSHRSYDATWPVRLFLCLGGAAAFQGSAKWWCRNHRAHHRYTDTDKDPYNARKGFMYAHIGWMLVKQQAKNIGFADITDLQNDWMITWQHNYYPWISITIGAILPTLIPALLWDDFWGGFYYATMLRIVVVHHATFFVNSLAHWYGDKSFSDLHTAFDSIITAVLTLGEGYHNYHHEFPYDYRNGVKIYHYDPTKWFIKMLSLFGLTFNLKKIPDHEIQKAVIQMQQRQLDYKRTGLNESQQSGGLPSMTIREVRDKVAAGELLVILDDMVHDVKNFIHEHPGGRQTLYNLVGKDATRLFNGQVADQHNKQHAHSKNAREYLRGMRIALLTSPSAQE